MNIRPATDFGFLLHKHPGTVQSFNLSFGTVHTDCPDVTDDRCTACLLPDVDAVGLVRGRNPDQNFLLALESEPVDPRMWPRSDDRD